MAVSASPARSADGIAGHVVEIDAKAKCLALDWDNDTRKKACWTETTRFADQDSGEKRSAADVRAGSYLRITGQEAKDAFQATKILIWEAASNPPGK